MVCLVASDVVKVPQTLDGLWPQEVVRVVGLNVEVRGGTGLRVEVRDLGGEKRGLPRERHVACVGHLFGPCELQEEKVLTFDSACLKLNKNKYFKKKHKIFKVDGSYPLKSLPETWAMPRDEPPEPRSRAGSRRARPSWA